MIRARYPARREAERNYVHKVDVPVPREGFGMRLAEMLRRPDCVLKPVGEPRRERDEDRAFRIWRRWRQDVLCRFSARLSIRWRLRH